MLLADLNVIFNPNFNSAQLGVDVTRCTDPTDASSCTTTVLDQTNSDRPWITHRGTTVWVSYHDSGNSTLVHVQQSTDDGQTWHKVSSPITGQGADTGRATFDNDQGPIVADPTSNCLYDVYAAGERQTKSKSADFNNIFVSRSVDGGKHWETNLVFHTTPGTALNNIFPSMTVDQTTGTVYAVWTDSHTVWVSSSTDHGKTWSTPTDNLVSQTPNRIGAVCTEGTACAGNTNRELLDLFEVAEDPLTDQAAIIYTSSEISVYTTPDGVVHKLPEIVLAYEQ
jgi:hypothetical protein